MVPTVKKPSSSAPIIKREISCCRLVFRILLSTVSGVTVFVAELALDSKVLGDLTAFMSGWR